MSRTRLATQLAEARALRPDDWFSLPQEWRPGTASSDVNHHDLEAYDELLLNGIEPVETPIGRPSL